MNKRPALLFLLALLLFTATCTGRSIAAPLPGGSLDPLTIPKYVTPLFIPPVMKDNGTGNSYNIAVRRFKQQILPGGIWDDLADPKDIHPNFQATPVWSYGPESDDPPDSSTYGGDAATAPAPNSQFNYPAYTVETTSEVPVRVRWINGLSEQESGRFQSDLRPVQETLQWAGRGNRAYTDCLYQLVQPAGTLWYHDHSLGPDRLNVHPGPSGFWLVRGGEYDEVFFGTKRKFFGKNRIPAILPGPPPIVGQGVLELNNPANPIRRSIREIPITIQDHSFNIDGTFFNAEHSADHEIDIIPDSDITPYRDSESFFNVMVVNGVSWPSLEVAPAKYRFRLLNGCKSRVLNLALLYNKKRDRKAKTRELPFIQIGAEQGFFPQVIEIMQGFSTILPGDGTRPKSGKRNPATTQQKGLFIDIAQRADVIVDFGGLADGTVVRMINTAPDASFDGFPAVPADPSTTGQIMEFVVKKQLRLASDRKTTDPYRLQPVADGRFREIPRDIRQLANNEEPEDVCVAFDEEGEHLDPSGRDQSVTSPGSGPEPFDYKETFPEDYQLFKPDSASEGYAQVD